MQNKEKLHIGMTVWVKSGTISSPHIRERKIDKVGSKYFYILQTKYSIETLKVVDDFYDGKVYLDKKDYENELRKDMIIKNIREKYNRLYTFSLEQLEVINKAINNKED